MKRRETARSIIAYTALFAAAAAACFIVFAVAGRSLVWERDGLKQHYTFMVYLGRWLRSLLAGSAPMFDLSLGWGEDVIAALNYYGLGDPLLWLAALAPESAMELCYHGLIVLRMYLAGLAALALARYKGYDARGSALGACAYAVCAVSLLWAATRHPLFANAWIHFPLMILGLEMVFDGKRPILLAVAVALSALCGFYFLYINSLLLLAYALVRNGFLSGRSAYFRELPRRALPALGGYLMGISLAGVVFLPSVLGFLSSGRTFERGEAGSLLLYSAADYINLPMNLLSSKSVGLGLCFPGLAILAALFVSARREKGDRQSLFLMGLALLAALVPFFGLALNGFAYVAARWTYAAALLSAMVLAGALGDMLKAEGKPARRTLLLTGAYLLYLAALAAVEFLGDRDGSVLLQIACAFCILAGSCFALYLPGILRRRGLAPREGAVSALLAAVMVVNALCGGLMTYSTRNGEMLKRGTVLEAALDAPTRAVDQAADGGFSRLEWGSDTSLMFNAGAISGANTLSAFNSILSGACVRFVTDLACASRVDMNIVNGLDARSPLLALWNARYTALPAEGAGRVPMGCALILGDDEWRVYENPYALGAGWVVSDYITRAEYDALPPLERQWALLQCAVLDGETEGLNHIAPKQNCREIPVADARLNGEPFSGGDFTVQAGDRLTLSLEIPGNAEAYLLLEGLTAASGLVTGNALVFDDGVNRSSELLVARNANQYFGRDDMLVNLGWSEAPRQACEITFSAGGRYSLSEISALVQPMDEFPAMIGALRQCVLEDAVLENNRITGRAALDREGVLVLSVPASRGWTAMVDGKPAALTDSADAFLALKLPAGEHDVVLSYRTPGLTLGILLSAAGLLALAATIFLRRKRKA